MIKVTITDNDALSRRATVQQLTHPDISIVAITTTSKALMQLLASQRPDIALINYRVTRPETLIAAEWIKKHYPVVKVLLTCPGDFKLPLQKLRHIGIEGLVLTSQQNRTQFLGTIYKIHRGDVIYPQ